MYKYLVWTLTASARIRLYRWLKRYKAKTEPSEKEIPKEEQKIHWRIHKSFTLIFFDCPDLRKYLRKQLERYEKHGSNDMHVYRCSSLTATDLDDRHLRKYMEHYRYTEKDFDIEKLSN